MIELTLKSKKNQNKCTLTYILTVRWHFTNNAIIRVEMPFVYNYRYLYITVYNRITRLQCIIMYPITINTCIDVIWVILHMFSLDRDAYLHLPHDLRVMYVIVRPTVFPIVFKLLTQRPKNLHVNKSNSHNIIHSDMWRTESWFWKNDKWTQTTDKTIENKPPIITQKRAACQLA